MVNNCNVYKFLLNIEIIELLWIICVRNALLQEIYTFFKNNQMCTVDN